jgi:calcineurin-like phosphoesterase family protein
MDYTILANINNLVKAQDTLWHLGDFAWSNPRMYLRSLACQHVHLLLGNHDKGRCIKELGHMSTEGLLTLHLGLVDMAIDGHKLTLCHYPMRSWNCSFHGAWHLYGHVHGKSSSWANAMDVGVDANKYKPVSWDSVVQLMESPENVARWEKTIKCRT